MFFLSSGHSELPDFMQSFRAVDFFCHRDSNTFSDFFISLLDMLEFFSEGFNSLSIVYWGGPVFQMVENRDPVSTFRCQKSQREHNGLLGFHNLHTLRSNKKCFLNLTRFWVFTNMQTILCFILWSVDEIHECHTLAFTDIHANHTSTFMS